jgi:hypothetical protein
MNNSVTLLVIICSQTLGIQHVGEIVLFFKAFLFCFVKCNLSQSDDIRAARMR